MALELEHRRLRVEHQRWLPLVYRGMRIERVYRLDMVVEDAVILELKAVKALEPIFDAQMLTYLRLSGCHTGLIINFNQRIVTRGIRRLVL